MSEPERLRLDEIPSEYLKPSYDKWMTCLANGEVDWQPCSICSFTRVKTTKGSYFAFDCDICPLPRLFALVGPKKHYPYCKGDHMESALARRKSPQWERTVSCFIGTVEVILRERGELDA